MNEILTCHTSPAKKLQMKLLQLILPALNLQYFTESSVDLEPPPRAMIQNHPPDRILRKLIQWLYSVPVEIKVKPGKWQMAPEIGLGELKLKRNPSFFLDAQPRNSSARG